MTKLIFMLLDLRFLTYYYKCKNAIKSSRKFHITLFCYLNFCMSVL